MENALKLSVPYEAKTNLSNRKILASSENQILLSVVSGIEISIKSLC